MIKIDILAEIQAGLAAIKSFQEKSNKLLSEMAKQGQSSFDTLTKSVVLLNQGLELGGKAWRAVSGTINEAVKSSIAQEEAINDLNQALRSNGKLTQASSDDLQKFSSALEKNSIFADEVILKASALGAQLGNLSGQQLKDATLAAANLASALGISLDSAMQKIIKSGVDGGTGLKRFGIVVEKGATNAITLANAIGKINDQFGGSALSKTETYAGALAKAGNSYDNLLESIGNFIVKNPLVVKIINIAAKAFGELEAIISKLDPAPINNLVAKGVILLIDSMILLTDVINPVITSFKILGQIGAGIFDTFKTGFNVIIGVFVSLTNMVATLVNKIPEKFLPDGWKQSLEEFKESTDVALETVQEKITEYATSAYDNFTTVGDSFASTINEEKLEAIKNVLRNTQTEIEKAAKASSGTMIKASSVVVVEEKKNAKTRSELMKEFYENWKKSILEFKSFEQSTGEERINNFKSSLSTISTLTSNNNSVLFEIGKAAAVANATIDGIAAVQKALAAAPPPFNFALAALVGVATAANIAKISATKRPKFADGGIVGGNNYSGDNVTVGVNSGEMILNRQQQASLFRQIKEGGDAGVVEAINRLGNRIANLEIVVKTDDIEIARSVRRALADGFALA